MSTSLLYQGFGIRGYPLKKTSFEGGAVFFEVGVPDDKLRCPACGSFDVVRYGGNDRQVRHLPIGTKPTFVRLRVPRVLCKECLEVRLVRLPFLVEGHTYTKAFEAYVLDLSRYMTIEDVAEHVDMSWDTIKAIQVKYLSRRYAKPKLGGLSLIAIDEISIAKGHRYVTLVLDLISGRVVFVGEGRDAKALDPFWKRLRRSRARVRAVAIDMSRAYFNAVTQNLPKATLVFDHFHVVKLFSEFLSDLRREVQREAATRLQKQVLKGTRWLLLKNPENLDDRRNERERLELALKMNKPLATAYYMKEDLRQVWFQPNKRTARRVFNDWIRRANVSDIPMLQRFAKTLLSHREGILAYYRFRISTGRLEGLNTKITVMKRKAYGFRDTEFFKLKILGLHETKVALVG